MKRSMVMSFLFLYSICFGNLLGQSLHVSGYSGTLVSNIGDMPKIELVPGTYSVSLAGPGISLWWAQPEPYKYVILWEGNINRHWLVESGEEIIITVNQIPEAELFAFLVDVNNEDSGGYVDLTFTRTGNADDTFPVLTKHPNNPIFPRGGSGTWENYGVYASSIIYENGVYKMWYTGASGESGIEAIGYAESADGITWERHPSNPVFKYAADINNACVIKVNNEYLMYYHEHRVGICLATSNDGISWAQYPDNPILTPGPAQWESDQLLRPWVIFDGSAYKMWYAGQQIRARIGYATSGDGIKWTKYSGNPVLNVDPQSSWENDYLAWHSVLWDGTRFLMFYTANDEIGVAFSNDGTDWERYANNPIIQKGNSGTWDNGYAAYPCAIYDAGIFRIWYTGSYEDRYSIGLAEGLNVTNIRTESNVPKNFVLHQNYPNPFNSQTTIEYTLTETSHVKLDIFNSKGQLIQSIVNEKQSAGLQQVAWEGDDSSGIYFYRLEAFSTDDHSKRQYDVKKMTLLK